MSEKMPACVCVAEKHLLAALYCSCSCTNMETCVYNVGPSAMSLSFINDKLKPLICFKIIGFRRKKDALTEIMKVPLNVFHCAIPNI